MRVILGSAASAAPANRREKRDALIVVVVVGVVGSVVEMEGVKKAVWVQALGESIIYLFIYLLLTICLMVGCLFRPQRPCDARAARQGHHPIMSSSNRAVSYPRPIRNSPRPWPRSRQPPSAPPPTAVVATAARRFDALPSVSRSSGLATDGDSYVRCPMSNARRPTSDADLSPMPQNSLKDHNTQNELYAHIQQKALPFQKAF